jgi:hypothetical protein
MNQLSQTLHLSLQSCALQKIQRDTYDVIRRNSCSEDIQLVIQYHMDMYTHRTYSKVDSKSIIMTVPSHSNSKIEHGTRMMCQTQCNLLCDPFKSLLETKPKTLLAVF